LLKEFREFVLRGNVVDLAVGIVIGTAFVAVVNKLVADLITPVIAATVGQPSFENLTFTIGRGVFKYGDFMNAVISFVLIAAAVFFLVVRPIAWMQERRARQELPSPTTRKCPYCMSEIANEATRCAYCTSEVEPVTAPA
jgi:large conductance mechanosensitive channel